MSEKRGLLITGAAGGLTNLVAEALQEDYRVVGVDTRSLSPGQEFPGEFYRIDYLHRKMADVFRKNSFHTLLHLGRLSVVATEFTRSQRFRINVLGTQKLLELALKYGIKRVVVLSTFHVYGAHQHNHIHINETEPLRASQIFPELVDAIELDHVTRVFLHQYRRVRTLLLRPVNVIGPRIHNRITQLLKAERCPILMGYDPVLQFIHEEDLKRAILLTLSREDQSGIYNVAGEGAIAYSAAIRAAGSRAVPIPHFLAYPAVGLLARFKLSFPKHLIDYFRYPTIVTDAAFRRDFGYEPSIGTLEALQSLRDTESLHS